MEGYRQRLAELVLRGMDSDVLSCRVSSTAVCVEVWLGAWRAGRAGAGCCFPQLPTLAPLRERSPGSEGHLRQGAGGCPTPTRDMGESGCAHCGERGPETWGAQRREVCCAECWHHPGVQRRAPWLLLGSMVLGKIL